MIRSMPMLHRAILAASLVFAASCGGGSSGSTGGNTPTPPVPPSPPASCDGSDLINIVGATDNGLSGMSNGPENAIDDNLEAGSRWESSGDPAVITLDMGERYLVREVGIAWFEGDTRVASFSILVSEDGTSFQPLLQNLQPSGETEQFERY